MKAFLRTVGVSVLWTAAIVTGLAAAFIVSVFIHAL